MKRVLIISYYWPPSGGPGVQRWLKFVKYLPEYNIEPILFVPKNANYPLIDNSLADQVDTDLKFISHPITEISKFLPKFEFLKSARAGNISIPANQSFFQKVFFFIRGNLFIPDMKIFWKNSSVNFLSDYISKNYQALEYFKQEQVKIKKFPKGVLTKLNKISNEVLIELSQENQLSKKVYDSYTNFLKRVRPWTLISEDGYLSSFE